MLISYFWIVRFFCYYFFFFFFVIGIYLFSVSFDTNYFFLLFVHVPLAWCGSLVYAILLISCFGFFYFKQIIWLIFCFICCFLGFFLSVLILWTGACWALPVWGSFFVLDLRVISVLILCLVFFFGFIALLFAFYGKVEYMRVLYLLSLSSLNVPLLKLSVYWWSTLHQTSSVLSNVSFIHGTLYFPLLLCFCWLLCFCFLCFCILFICFYETFFNT